MPCSYRDSGLSQAAILCSIPSSFFVLLDFIFQRNISACVRLSGEDVYGMTVSEVDGKVCLKVSKDKGKGAYELLQMLYAWKEQAHKLSAGEISRDDYDRWRYYYPKYDITQLWTKVPSQELSDTLVEAFQDKLRKDE